MPAGCSRHPTDVVSVLPNEGSDGWRTRPRASDPRAAFVRPARDARDVVVIRFVFSTAEVIGCLVAAVGALFASLAVRRKVLQRRWPTFEASVRTTPKPMGRGWTLGLGCYDHDVLRWYRLLSLRMQPGLVVDRRTLQITGSRCPIGHEARALLSGHVVLEVRDGDRLVELGVGDAARTHLTAWIETASRSGEQSLDPSGRVGRIPPGTTPQHRAAQQRPISDREPVDHLPPDRIPLDDVVPDRAAFQATTAIPGHRRLAAGFQSTSGTPADAFTERARTNSRSDSRLR